MMGGKSSFFDNKMRRPCYPRYQSRCGPSASGWCVVHRPLASCTLPFLIAMVTALLLHLSVVIKRRKPAL
ncbi:hypothetical protein DM02DRAFT_383593 [Periconia macrospinosa]|uniref:Uncharacterized protein n=1 Tax=Periconia macrospinosa TaxID=97972 RepID=A0A2V1EAH9_9PLEO|nr:hypothetical protein DM02DRAFT_383593 [Periconia macrospinosa]